MYVSNFRYEIPYRMGSASHLPMFPGNETTVTTQQRFVKCSFFSIQIHILFIVTSSQSKQKDSATCLPEARTGILAK